MPEPSSPNVGKPLQGRYSSSTDATNAGDLIAPQGLAPSGPPTSEEVKPPLGDHPVGRDAERSELKRAFCSSLSEL
jgi:hypothetical protein